MKRLVVMAALAAMPSTAKADGLFMGLNWGGGTHIVTSQSAALPAIRDPEPRAEDNDGTRAYKLQRFSVQVPFYGQPFAGRTAKDGICDELQPRAWDNIGIIGYKNSLPVTRLYTSGRGSCESVYYPGFTFFGGPANMALAPHWDGQPDFIPRNFNYMDWLDPRYNPALRYGG